MTNVEGGAVKSGGPARDRTIGASPLTQQIYRVVVKAGRPVTAVEIYQQIKDSLGFRTDTSLWWQRRNASRKGNTHFIASKAGLARVRERVRGLARDGVLISDGATGKGAEARYTKADPERPPKGYRRHLHPGEQFGWYDIDIAAEDQRLADRQALYELRNQIRAELDRPKLTARMRQLLSEADRLLGKVSLQ